ncbi:hypothetical protein CSUI_007564 [Cystoisospora suis]|uniref:Uncharacterized protein n=1 Tax=Cystoisospora suis TaxID=483139 RepID=A0A2C6KQI7_9APIC|nr:hypothetical protein CSUI_007564 [Cystoisospora suis]
MFSRSLHSHSLRHLQTVVSQSFPRYPHPHIYMYTDIYKEIYPYLSPSLFYSRSTLCRFIRLWMLREKSRGREKRERERQNRKKID